MANTLRFKRGLVSGIPTAALGEPLFTTDTFDLYIGNGTGNTRFQKYIASGTTSQLLRGDGSLYTFPLNISSPTTGQVLKYNGTSWVNDSDAGITGSGSAGQVAYFTGATTQSGSTSFTWDNTNSQLIVSTNSILATSALRGLKVTNTNSLGYANLLLANDTTDVGQVILTGTSGLIGGTNILARQVNLINAGGTGGINLLATAGNISFLAGSGSTSKMVLFQTGNLVLNSTSDNGLRFQVTGDGYFSGSVGIGSSTLTARTLRLSKNITGGGVAYGIFNDGQVQSDVNTVVFNYDSQSNTASGFTLPSYVHYRAAQATLNGTVTSQTGFLANSNLTGATNNYGFYGDIASGTGRWNLYMNGSASNYLNGGLAIAGTTLNANALLQINANANDNRVILISNTNAGTSAQAAIQLTSNAGTASFNVYSSAFGITEFASTALLSSGLMANGLLLNTATTSPIVFRTNSTERMRIFSGGNVAISTTTDAGFKLDVNGTMRVSGASTFSSSVTAGGNILASSSIGDISLKSAVVGDYFPRMYLERTGGTTRTNRLWSFAIGTNGGLYINDTTGSIDALILNASTGAATFSSSVTATSYNATTQNIFSVGGTEGMRLTATNRNLHIGTFSSDSGEKLQVNGTMRVSGASTFANITSTVGNQTFTNSDANAYTRITTLNSNVQLGLFRSGINAGGVYIGASSTQFYMYDSNLSTLMMSVTPTGAATFSSSVTAASYNATTQNIFSVGGTEGMRLTATNRNLHIGTFSSDSGEKLQVVGTAKIGTHSTTGFSLVVQNNGANDVSGIRISTGATVDGYLSMAYDATNTYGSIQAGDNNVFRNIVLNRQGGSVGIGAVPNNSAVLQADSTTRGFLPPRMTTTQRNAIPTPAAGLIVYDTTDNKHYGYDGTNWNAFY